MLGLEQQQLKEAGFFTQLQQPAAAQSPQWPCWMDSLGMLNSASRRGLFSLAERF